MLEKLAKENENDCRVVKLDNLSAAEHPNNLALQGQHNQQNCAAARIICRHFGVTDNHIDKAIQSFAGLPHRLQLAGQFGQIRFINDSKATNGEAAAKALASFTQIHWCAGDWQKVMAYLPAYPISKMSAMAISTATVLRSFLRLSRVGSELASMTHLRRL